MLEIFAVPYLGVSAFIGWAVFGPFFRATDDIESTSMARVATTDLLAIPLPFAVMFQIAESTMPERMDTFLFQGIVLAVSAMFAAAVLGTGLWILPKSFPVNFPKRLTVIGVIAPLGLTLTIGWVGFLLWAGSHSMTWLIPSSAAIVLAIVGLRFLSLWICRPNTDGAIAGEESLCD